MKSITPCVLLDYIEITPGDPAYATVALRYAEHIQRQNRLARLWRRNRMVRPWQLWNRLFNLF